jgi:hypothetical protein
MNEIVTATLLWLATYGSVDTAEAKPADVAVVPAASGEAGTGKPGPANAEPAKLGTAELRTAELRTADPGTVPPAAATPALSGTSTERPAWVDEPAGLRAGGLYFMNVVVGPEVSRTDCERKLPEEIESRLIDYAADVMPRNVPVAIPFDIANLRPRIVSQVWEERIRSQTVDLVFLHVQLRIDDKLRQEWKDQGIAAVRQDHSRVVLLGYGLAIAATAAAFVFLKWSGRRAGVGPAAAAMAVVMVVNGVAVSVGAVAASCLPLVGAGGIIG